MINSFATRSLLFILILFGVLLYPAALSAQVPVPNVVADSSANAVAHLPDTAVSSKNVVRKDSLSSADSSKVDTLLHKKSKNALKSKVAYKSQDSIIFDLRAKKAFLYNEAEVYYEKTELKAAYVDMGFHDKTVFAKGVLDSAGKLTGAPAFEVDGQKGGSKEMKYNFDSKKGIMYDLITQDGEAYLHGYKVKKVDSNVMYLNGGCFTTCDLDHPHYGLEFTKAKAITGDRVITGTSYMTIEDVPTPLIIPFGFFPFSKQRRSGVIIPSYGYAANRGYYLDHGGYYFAISDNWDLTLLGKIYTNLSYAVDARANYYKRYKYGGDFNLIFEDNKQGVPNTSSYQRFQDFAVRWNHRQDAKANPNSTFSASVDLVSPRFGKWSTNSNTYLKSTTSSSIAYTTKLGEAFNLSTGLKESYNIQTQEFEFHLPTVNLSSKQFTPFRTKKSSSPFKWFEEVTIKYTMDFDNFLQSPDSTLFDGNIFKKMNNGFKHSIPISSSYTIFKHLNWVNSINYTERWYFKTIDSNFVKRDTNWGFSANREAEFSTSLSTKIYGMANFKNFYVNAIRHVFSPSLSLSYHPDFGNPDFGYWKSYRDTAGMRHYYSIYQGGIYGFPPQGESGTLGFSLGNNLEMKVRSKSDTVTGTKKIMLIENLTVGMSYNFAADSLNLSPLYVNGHTTLFKNLVVTYTGVFSPYAIDESTNRMTNEFLWHKEKKVFKNTNTTWDFKLNWSLNPETFKGKQKSESSKDSLQNRSRGMYLSPFHNPNEILADEVDFSVPWNLTINYGLTIENEYIAKLKGRDNTVTQTLGLQGDFNLTEKWKIGFSTGYDFKAKAISYTAIDLYRDLHCWEMRFRWIPFGFQKSWNFTIAIKANMLKDAKYEMKSDFRDVQPYY